MLPESQRAARDRDAEIAKRLSELPGAERLPCVSMCLVTFQALNPTVPRLSSSVGEPVTFFVIRLRVS